MIYIRLTVGSLQSEILEQMFCGQAEAPRPWKIPPPVSVKL